MSLLHWVWLGLAVQPGSPLLDAVLKEFPDPEEFFLSGESGIAKVGGISQADALRIRKTKLSAAQAAFETAKNFGADVLCRTSPQYPQKLLEIKNAPAVLYAKGDLDCLNRMPAIATVGTRNISDYGKRISGIIAGGLGAAGAVVISGMAKGTDTACHEACLSAGGKTVAVQGCGICNTFPAENEELKERIMENGAVISEFAPDAKPQSSFFPIRNRIVSGMSLGVCVIEAAARSGTSITARLAAEQGRDVFAVPADVLRPTSQGTLKLLRSGAVAVASAEDILSEYENAYPEIFAAAKNEFSQRSHEQKSPSRSVPEHTPRQNDLRVKRPAPPGLSPEAKAVYAAVDFEPLSVDEISDLAKLSSGQTSAALTELEIFGLIRPVAGRRFRLE